VFKDYCGFHFTLVQTNYTSLELPFFKESNEPSFNIVEKKHAKVMVLCLEGSVTFTQNGNNQCGIWKI